MVFLIKYWHYITIACLVGVIGAQKIYTDSRYYGLEKQLTEIKTKALQDTVDIQASTIEYQATLFNENFKLMEGFRNDLQQINSQHIANINKLNSLHKTLDSNRSYFDSASKASLVGYSSTLTDLFKGCGGMVVGRSEKADAATAAAVTYHSMLTTNYEATEKLGADLRAKGFDVKIVSSDSVENK